MKPQLKGMILIIIIGLLGMMVFLSITFVLTSKQNKAHSAQSLYKTRAKLLAQSGFNFLIETYQYNFFLFDQGTIERSIGQGTFKSGGDVFQVSAQDANGKININDGINAGQAMYGTNYLANSIDPYFPYIYGSYFIPLSAQFNLRLRRILNAYGDIHRFTDRVFQGDYKNIDYYYKAPLPDPVFSIEETYSSDGRRYQFMAAYINNDSNLGLDPNKNKGLGDVIVLGRPQAGYQNINEIEQIVNDWASNSNIKLSNDYLKGGNFYDLMKDDLTISSFEDEKHYYETAVNGLFQAFNPNNDEKKGDFFPVDMQLNDIYLPYTLNTPVQLPTPLINLNQASFFVRAAVFYAPVNVDYSVEGATTIPPYIMRADSNEKLTPNTGREAMIASPSIGVMGPVFEDGREKMENGHADKGHSSHLMSLRDAMALAKAYEQYIDPTKNPQTPIQSFDDFYDFLVHYETSGNPHQEPRPFERTLPLIDEEGQPTYPLKDGIDFNAGGLFHVAPFASKGVFTQDYVSKTLPHILSSIIRIPSWYGAPPALQSPYMVHKPDHADITNYGYKNAHLCRQGFRKVEDFMAVARTSHLPKVCFLPCGSIIAQSSGLILDQQQNIITSSTIDSSINFFDTNYYRCEQDFDDLTVTNPSDPNDPKATHKKIIIGPETNAPVNHQSLGVVGLKDYDQDLDEDPFMLLNGTGYQPQIILNFNYDPNNIPPLNGLENLSNTTISPERIDDADNDDWLATLYPDGYTNVHGFSDDEFYLSGTNQFTVDSSSLSPLSPFNGLRLTAIGQGEFADDNLFSQSLYFRLDDWLDPAKTTGENLSRGIMTFWFRLPSDYDYPTQVRSPLGVTLSPESFSRILAHLNLWENYEFDLSEDSYYRPISLTIGVKKTKKRGLNVFARYDSGGEHHNGLPYFYGPTDYKGPSPYQTLEIAEYDDGLTQQYDFLGFWCNAELIDYQEQDLPDYQSYRWIAHRSSEVSVSFANKKENGPGSWHRLTTYWNLGWDRNSQMTSEKQLYLILHDHTNKHDEHQTEFHQGVYYAEDFASGYSLGDPFNYPRDALNVEEGGNVGFMFPHDSAMILSFGEAHARRLGLYRLRYETLQGLQIIKENKTSTIAQYYSFWRLNSSIDNIRLWMGPHTPSLGEEIPDEYFDVEYYKNYLNQDLYSSLRYEITHTNHGFEKTVEPTWVIDPKFPEGTQIYAIGTRVYYPPDSDNNIPYVFLSASNNDGDGAAITPSAISQYEQDLLYDHLKTSSNFRIRLQYKAFKPSFDGNQTNMEDDPLIYFGEDNWTCVPWIKELSIRYQLLSGPQVLSWEQD